MLRERHVGIIAVFVVALLIVGLVFSSAPDTEVIDEYADDVFIAQRTGINLISGTNVTISGVDNPTDNRVDFTIAATGVGSEVVFSARKDSAGTIAKGSAVHLAGFNPSGFIEVEEADADDPTKMPAIGLAETDLTNSSTGLVILVGELTDFDTTGFAFGNDLFVSTTPGVLTATKPTGNSTQIQKVAEVSRVHVSQGVVEVFGAGRTNDLPNITDDSLWVGSATDVPTNTAVGDCDDSGGNHLNYDTTTNTFSCGTTNGPVAALTSGTIDGVTIGGSTPAAGTFTTLTATGATSLDGGTFIYNTSEADLDARFAGSSSTNLLYLDASENSIGIGNVAGAGKLIRTGTYATSATPTNNAAMLSLEGVFTHTNSAGTATPTFLSVTPAGIETAGETEAVARITTAFFTEPTITLGTGDSVIDVATIWIAGFPTEGTNDYALYIPTGPLGVSNGSGTSGQQLTSGGAGGNLSWTADSSVRESKNVVGEHTDADAALVLMVTTPVYDFTYKESEYETVVDVLENGRTIEWRRPTKPIVSTGDYETPYVGIMADEAPWAMHYDGRILNPINTFGYTILAFKALDAKNQELEARIIALEDQHSIVFSLDSLTGRVNVVMAGGVGIASLAIATIIVLFMRNRRSTPVYCSIDPNC